MERTQTNLIVVHCSATPNGKSVSVADIRRWHKERGFKDIGYHWVIDVDGSLHEGRPEDEIGAHAQGVNARSIGVCLVGGTGGPCRNNPGRYTQAQWDSLRRLVRDLLERYPKSSICGHRDLSPDLDHDGVVEPNEWGKLCPSFDVTSWLAHGMEPDGVNILRTAPHA